MKMNRTGSWSSLFLPSSQRCPIQPAPHTHCPVCPSHCPPFSHTHSRWQSGPKRPATHSETKGTEIKKKKNHWKQVSVLNINIGFIIQVIKMNVGNLFSALIIHVVFASLLTDWIKTCYAVIRYNCHTFLVLGFRITCMMQQDKTGSQYFQLCSVSR